MILHYGTFDVDNFGDLLFPHVIESGLGGAFGEIVHVSPSSSRSLWPDACVTITCEEASQIPNSEVAGVILGGGQLVHVSPSDVSSYVDEDDLFLNAYPKLWYGAALRAWKSGCPLVWNSPGVPSALPHRSRALLRWATSSADLLAVRDQASLQNLVSSDCAEDAIMVVPDSAFGISNWWPRDSLLDDYMELVSANEFRGERTLAVHVKARIGLSFEEVAQAVDRLASDLGAVPILIAIGLCNEDQKAVAVVSGKMTEPHIALVNPESLRLIAACIAFSEAYYGSSLHGLICAVAYGRHGAIVHPRPPSKMAAVLQLLGTPELLYPSWRSLILSVADNADTLTYRSTVSDGMVEIRRMRKEFGSAIAVALSSPAKKRDRPPTDTYETFNGLAGRILLRRLGVARRAARAT